MASERPSYLQGPGFVVHKSGTRLSREDCESNRKYLLNALSEAGWSEELQAGRLADLKSLEAAMSASFPQHQQEAAE